MYVFLDTLQYSHILTIYKVGAPTTEHIVLEGTVLNYNAMSVLASYNRK